ncbi:MAG: LysR family transcriptional regulator [Pseudomonadota bacterium]
MTSHPHSSDIDAANWAEMRTAYMVGELHTLSRTAHHLGVHRSTIMRQITTLESRLGRRVFVRGRNGYEPTEFGRELIAVTRQAAEEFREFFLTYGTTRTTIASCVKIAAPSYLSCVVTTVLATVQDQAPDLLCSFFSIDDDCSDIVQGADIIISLADFPENDHATQKLAPLEIGLFASTRYVEKHGQPASLQDLSNHRFVSDNSHFSGDEAASWLKKYVPTRSIVFCSASRHALHVAIKHGMGIGFLPTLIGSADHDLVQIEQSSAVWTKTVWASVRRECAEGAVYQTVLHAIRRYLNASREREPIN